MLFILMKIRICHKPNGDQAAHRLDSQSPPNKLNFCTVAEAREYCKSHGLKDRLIVIDHQNGEELLILYVRNSTPARGKSEVPS